PVRQEIQRCAQGADDTDVLPSTATHAVGDQHRVVLANDLAEVSGSRQVMVQAAIGNQEDLAAGDLPIDHAAHIDAGFADQVTAELDGELRLRECAARV